jgi:hypothetical protein
MSAGVEWNWTIVDSDGSLSTMTRSVAGRSVVGRSVVGRFASKAGLVVTEFEGLVGGFRSSGLAYYTQSTGSESGPRG